MFVSTKNAVLLGTLLIAWMCLKTFITETTGFILILIALLFGAVQYFKLPKLDDEKISDNILQLFKFDENNKIQNIIFHKGGASHAPENTIEAIQQAASLGIRSVEIDVDFTKDGVGVVIHGPLVDDTTDGTGFVSDYTYDEIQTLNAAAKFVNQSKFPNVRIPTLEACVKECIDKNLIVFLDCKGQASQTAKLVCELFKTYPMLYSSAVVCSFYPQIVYAVRQTDPNIVTAVTHRNYILSLLGDGTERNKELWKRLVAPIGDVLLAWAHWAFIWYICGNSFILLCKDCISVDVKKFWSSLGIRLLAWTVNDPQEQNFLLNIGVPIITDGLVEGGPASEVSQDNESSSDRAK